MYARTAPVTALLTAFASCIVAGSPAAELNTATLAAHCASCHSASPGTMLGFLDRVSDKALALQLDLGGRKAVLGYDEGTVLKNVASIADLDKHKGEGFLVNVEDTDHGPLATSMVRFDIDKTIGEAEKLGKLAFKLALKKPSVTVLDVRPAPMYTAAHVPGAGSMPAASMDDSLGHLPTDRAAPVVIYGAGGCLGPVALQRLKQLGYRNVRVYVKGFADWTRTEPSVTTPGWVRRAIDEPHRVVVLDVRSPETAAAGHIRGAVNIPLNQLRAHRQGFPSEATAPIVVYGDGSEAAARELVRWGYRAVRVLPMAFAEWAQAGHPVDHGPTEREIVYRSEPRPGVITRAEFEQLAKSPRDGVVLIDLRDRIEIEEPAAEHIVNIPFNQVQRQMQTLTGGPVPVFYCPTGARAEMAYHLVTQAGGDCGYLATGAVVGKDGALKDARPWWAP